MKLKWIVQLLLILVISQANAAVEPTSGRYIDTVEDLSIQVIGGPLVWERHYRDKQWRFNYSWSSLVFEYDTSSGQIRRIIRGKDTYEKLDSAGTLFKFGPRMRIKKNDDGTWTWKDRNGNSTEYAANGKTLSLHQQAGSFITLMYNGDDRLSGAKDVNDNQVLWITYDPINGQVDTVRDYGNRELKYTWEGINGSSPTKYKLANVKDARGYDWQYAYGNSPATNGYVDLISMTDPELRETKIAYGGSGRVSSITNALGHVTSYQFDYIKARKEFYLKTTYPGGRITENWYARDGEVKRRDVNGINLTTITEDQRKDIVKDTFSRTTVMEYDEFRNLLKTTYPDGSSTSATYDVSNSNVLTRTDERGTVTKYDYFPNGRLKTMTEALGTAVERSTTYTYDQFGQLKTLTQVGDAVTETALTQYFYDDYGNMKKMINAENHETEYTQHDSMGNVLTKIDARDKEWDYTYDTLGNLTSTKNPLSHITSRVYDSVGNLIRETYPDNTFIEYDYDKLNRAIKQKNELQFTISIDYDTAGNRVKETDEVGRVTTNSYDLLNRLKTSKDHAGNIIVYHYPESGLASHFSIFRPIRIAYPTLARELKYNLRGRVIEQVTRYSDGVNIKDEVTQFRYDVVGNHIETIDAELNSEKTQYDVLNRVIKSIEPNEIETLYNHDNRDNILTLVDSLQQSHTFTYDKLNQKLTEIRPMGQIITYGYDPIGNKVNEQDAKGQLVAFEFDDANRKVKEDYYTSEGVLDTSIITSFNLRNNPISLNDGVSLITMTYDAAQQKLTEVVQYDGGTYMYSYTYHADGQKASFKGLDGITYSYFYNEIGILNNVIIPNEGSITYQDFNWFQSELITYPGNISRTNEHDGLQRLMSFTVKNSDNITFMEHAYTYTSVGNISSRTTQDGIYQYDYDDIYRLTTADYPSQSDESYTYDAMGNRKTDSNTGETQWLYDQNNRLLNSGTHLHEYDINGNQIIEKDYQGQIQRKFIYNTQNRLVEVKDGNDSTIASYYYDPLGRRLSKTVFSQGQGSVITYFHYNDEGLSAEKTGEEVISYTFHPQSLWSSNPLFVRQNSSYYYFQNEVMALPNLIHDADGNVVNNRYLKAFGGRLNGVEAIANPFGFPGQYYDTETNNYYNFKRNYNQKTGRYIQSDPIKLEGGTNLYTYSVNNPLIYFDNEGTNAGGALLLRCSLGPIAAATCLAPLLFCALNPDICIPDPPNEEVFCCMNMYSSNSNENTTDVPRDIHAPARRKGLWTCKGRADCNDNIPGNCPEDPKRRFAFGVGARPSLGGARNVAKSRATHHLGCQPKHVSCKCTGPKGEQYNGGC